MEDPTTYNVTDSAGNYLCPVCGWRGFRKNSIYGRHGGLIGTGFCCCCLFEPGFDDCRAASGIDVDTIIEAIRLFREKWIAEGMPWKCRLPRHEPCPTGWNAERQLETLLSNYAQCR